MTYEAAKRFKDPLLAPYGEPQCALFIVARLRPPELSTPVL